MSKKLAMLMLVVAAILCSHQLVVAEEAAIGAELSSSVSRSYPFPGCCDYDKWKIRKCMSKSACVDDCCPTLKRILGCQCACYRYANYFDKQALTSLASHCGFKNPCPPPCSPPPPPPPPPPRPQPPPSCSATDKAKINTCMTTPVSMDECCPTYKSTIARSCSCHQYAEQLNYQDVITIEAYCEVTSPCKKVQVIELPQ